MERARRHLFGLLFAILLLGFAERAGAQDARGAPEASPTLEAARKRWERLSTEEKAKARSRYERYRNMTEEERLELAERARRLENTRERVLREMSPADRERFAKLAPEKRRELVEELVESEARELGGRLREELPALWVERLERARPEDRARFLAELKRDQGERMTHRAIEDVGGRLALAPDEIARLQELPLGERRLALLALRKRQAELDVEQRGLPPWATREQWDVWRTLPPGQFLEALQSAQREHAAETGLAPPLPPHPLRPPHAPNIGEPQRAQPPEQVRAQREVAAALRARPEDLLELADLPQPERERRLADRRRERALDVIRNSAWLPPERVTELERLPPKRFFEVLRKMLRGQN